MFPCQHKTRLRNVSCVPKDALHIQQYQFCKTVRKGHTLLLFYFIFNWMLNQYININLMISNSNIAGVISF